MALEAAPEADHHAMSARAKMALEAAPDADHHAMSARAKMALEAAPEADHHAMSARAKSRGLARAQRACLAADDAPERSERGTRRSL
jgi:hypothetical protein